MHRLEIRYIILRNEIQINTTNSQLKQKILHAKFCAFMYKYTYTYFKESI